MVDPHHSSSNRSRIDNDLSEALLCFSCLDNPHHKGSLDTTMHISFCLFGLLSLRFAIAENALDEPFSSSFAKLAHAPCVSLFYRNGRLGCGTEDRSVNVGKLKYFKGDLPEADGNYVAVIEDYMLTSQTISTLSAARGEYLQGILVLNSTSDNDDDQGSHTFYSPDAQSPQGYGTPSEGLQYGYYSYSWNPKGQNLFNHDLYGIPMAYVMDSDVSGSLREEALSDALDASIVAEFNYYMGADEMDSKTCLAWEDSSSGEWSPKCLPLGGSSVWASTGSPPNPNKNNGNKKPVIMVAAGMDSTSMFHDVAPGANTAASNILTLLMAAKLIGDNINDATLDGFNNRIVFGFFQGESYGFVGSRSFLKDKDYPGFQCKGNLVHQVSRLGDESDYACINPVRPSVAFASLGAVAGMISVDQVGHEMGDGVLYVHADQNNDDFGKFVANTFMNSGTNYFSVSKASVNNNNNGYPYPPSPLTSLLSLSEGSVGGAVLTGYDYAFTNKAPYHSHLDSASIIATSRKSVAAAATIIARAAVAAAYDDGSYDYETASAYALNLIPELDYDDETLGELANCFYYDGECDVVKKYANVEYNNDRTYTGLNLAGGSVLGTPPNYYVSVYNRWNGQPFVQVGDYVYGAYAGDDYGKRNSDAVGVIPGQLAMTIHGLMNDFLGRGTINDDNPGQQCSRTSDCGSVDYCDNYGERAVCTGGGMCVCKRAHYHAALDEALKPAAGKPTGYFEFKDNDSGVSPVYTEPFWSNNVGVKVYRDVGWVPGFLTLVGGLAAGGISIFSAFVLKVGLKKEKLY